MQISSGFDGSVNLSGTAGNVGLTAEVSYKAADVRGFWVAGTGGYIQAAFSMPGITPIVLAGMTQDGFMAFRDFGFVMVGGNESTTVVNVGNSKGDLMFVLWCCCMTSVIVSVSRATCCMLPMIMRMTALLPVSLTVQSRYPA